MFPQTSKADKNTFLSKEYQGFSECKELAPNTIQFWGGRTEAGRGKRKGVQEEIYFSDHNSTLIQAKVLSMYVLIYAQWYIKHPAVPRYPTASKTCQVWYLTHFDKKRSSQSSSSGSRCAAIGRQGQPLRADGKSARLGSSPT